MKLFFFLFCFISVQVRANSTDTILNHQAKDIVFQQSLDKAVKPDFYKGKILILDFWATWCAPCIAGFPHFNELARKYSNSSVIFASIADEPLTTVSRFFTRTKKELYAVKLIDTTKTTLYSFKAFTIPYCVIIDKTNTVKWIGNTNDLTESIVEDILGAKQAYTKPAVISAPAITNLPAKPIVSRTSFSFNANSADPGKINEKGGFSYGTQNNNITNLSSHNNPLTDIIELISGYSKTRFITNNTDKIKQHVDFDYKIGPDTSRFKNYKNLILKNSSLKNFVVSLLGTAFKFDAKIITQKQKHYELFIGDTAKLHSFISMQSKHSSFSDDYFPRFEIVGYKLNDIVSNLESSTKNIITVNTRQ